MKLIEIYQCFGDATRLRILHLLQYGPLGVSHFQALLGEPQVKMSRHLRRLKGAKIIEALRYESRMIYRLADEKSPELERHLKCLEECAPSEAVLQGDLERLRDMQPEVAWASVAVAKIRKAEQERAVKQAGGI